MDGLEHSMPPERLAARLRERRRALGRSRRDLARETGLARRDLAAYERARVPIPGAHLERIAAALGGPDELLTERRPLEIGTDRVDAGDHSRAVTTPGADGLLEAYVHLLASLRGTRPGDAVPLRTADLEELARALGSEPGDVESRIVAVMGCTRDEAARLHAELRRRRILVPAAGMALGLTALSTTAIGPPEPSSGDEPARAGLVVAEDVVPAPARPAVPATPAPDGGRGAHDRPDDPAPPTAAGPRPTVTARSSTPATPPPAARPSDPAPGPAGPASADETPDPRRAPGRPPPSRPTDAPVSIPEGTAFVEVDPITGEPFATSGDADAPVSIPEGAAFVEVDPDTGEPLDP